MKESSLLLCPGALHIHSAFSHDCDTPIPEIVAAAREMGLQWIILTDHDSLGGLSYQGWHDGVLVIVGHEITPAHNHFLALDLDEVVDHSQPPQQFVDEVYARGGFGIIAHPDDRTTNRVKKKYYAWDDWRVDGPRERNGQAVGLELWNLVSDWGAGLTPLNKYLRFFFLRQNLHGPTTASLEWWDRLNMEGKPTFGVAGVDAHAMKRRMPWGSTVEVFSYRRSFGSLTNYLLLDTPLDPDDATRARQQVFAALKRGRLFFVNRLDGDITELPCMVTRGDEQWSIGDRLSLEGGPLTFEADVGRIARVQLLRNGKVHASGWRGLRDCLDEPGVYRLEAYHRSGRPWLFTNPLSIQRSNRENPEAGSH